jgi:hypothetical protein
MVGEQGGRFISMRRASLLLLFLASTLFAQSPSQRFRSAYTQWTAHRRDGMTRDDDSEIAIKALNAMWSEAGQIGVDFLTDHPTPGANELSKHLESILSVTDPRFGPPLSADSLEIRPGLFVVAFNSYPAGDVFAVARKSRGAELLWNLSLGGAQGKDPRHLLASWHVSRAGDACLTRYSYASGVCGPMTSASVGSLFSSRAGEARFFVRATYSKDMGGTDDEQISIWSVMGGVPRLEWINLYAEGGEEETVPNGVELKMGCFSLPKSMSLGVFQAAGRVPGDR